MAAAISEPAACRPICKTGCRVAGSRTCRSAIKSANVGTRSAQLRCDQPLRAHPWTLLAPLADQVSYEMMLLAELEAATLITKQMVQRGDYEDAAVICRAMADHGHAVRQQLSPPTCSIPPPQACTQTHACANVWCSAVGASVHDLCSHVWCAIAEGLQGDLCCATDNMPRLIRSRSSYARRNSWR